VTPRYARLAICETFVYHGGRLEKGDPKMAEQNRNERQRVVLSWVRRTFGEGLLAIEERVARLLEEVVELAQAEGLPEEKAHALVAHVYGKPSGAVLQEVGGIGVTLLAYCGAAGISADGCEAAEVARVLALPAKHFHKRQNIKAAAGVSMPVAEGKV
jgi:hypothetical protein